MSRQLFEEARRVLTQETATKLDPVGQEDKDIDNDGDSDKTDSYLKKRRGAISAAIAKGKNESKLSEEDIAKLKAILGEMKDKEEEDDDDEMEDDDEKMKKEEAEQIDEISLGLAKRARDKAEYTVDMDYDDLRAKPYGYSEKQRSKFQRYIDKKEPRAKGDRDWDPPVKKEEVEQVDEAGRMVKGKGYDNPENMRKAPEGDSKMSSMMPGYDERAARFLARQAKGKLVKGKAQSGPQREDFELVENLNIKVSDTPSYHEYIKAALTIAECNSLLELSEEDQQYIISEMEEAFKTNDIDFILEANAIADMKASIASLKNKGCVVEGFYEDDQLFYVYGDKDTGVIRKVFYEGTQKVTQVLENLGQDISDFTTKFDAYMKKKYGNDAPSLKPRTAQSVIKPVAPGTKPPTTMDAIRNIPLPRKI